MLIHVFISLSIQTLHVDSHAYSNFIHILTHLERHSQMYSLDLLSVVLKRSMINHVTFAHVRYKVKHVIGYIRLKHTCLEPTY